jgi:hypothetical protein
VKDCLVEMCHSACNMVSSGLRVKAQLLGIENGLGRSVSNPARMVRGQAGVQGEGVLSHFRHLFVEHARIGYKGE